MKVTISDKGRPVLVDDAGQVVGEVCSITFPEVSGQTGKGTVHEIDRANSVIGDVQMRDGRFVKNVRLPIR
jgi:hypothetical protein